MMPSKRRSSKKTLYLFLRMICYITGMQLKMIVLMLLPNSEEHIKKFELNTDISCSVSFVLSAATTVVGVGQLSKNMATYDLRARKDVSYTEDKTPLPRAIKVKNDKLYPIEVVKRMDNRVLINYVGYDEKYDEWRAEEEIVEPAKKKPDVYHPFSLYNELSYQIKLALDSKRRKEPDVKIEIPFDDVLFNGGLRLQGFSKGFSYGHEVFSIRNFSDVDLSLGVGWWYRCLNKHLNFCYVNKETVRYYLHDRVSVQQYNPDKGEIEGLSGGCSLVFKFVRMDGVAREWTNHWSLNHVYY